MVAHGIVLLHAPKCMKILLQHEFTHIDFPFRHMDIYFGTIFKHWGGAYVQQNLARAFALEKLQ
jgi:hypothetical protein